MKFKTLFSALALVFFCTTATATDALPDDPDLMAVMKAHDATGTIILASKDGSKTYIYNNEKANTLLAPACTFNIAHVIAAIEEGTLKDQHEIYKWDGQKRAMESWNQDQSLKSSFQISCIWFYQALAPKVGRETYVNYLKKLDYGNQLIGENFDLFWVTGDLRITPLQQIAFLKKIDHKELPISENTYTVLKDVMLAEENPNYRIYAKTGAATKDWVGHVWFVGYVESKNETWYFVTNLLNEKIEDLPKRKAVIMAALKQKGII